MIARIWHGMTSAEKGDEFYQYILQTGDKAYRNTEGNLGVFILRRYVENKAEFILISLWESIEAVKRFAGDDYNKASYSFPKDEEYLIELEPEVKHFDVLTTPN